MQENINNKEIDIKKQKFEQALLEYIDASLNAKDNFGHVYQSTLNIVDEYLTELVMLHLRGNQSKSAICLGLSRGTLRAKLQRNINRQEIVAKYESLQQGKILALPETNFVAQEPCCA